MVQSKRESMLGLGYTRIYVYNDYQYQKGGKRKKERERDREVDARGVKVKLIYCVLE